MKPPLAGTLQDLLLALLCAVIGSIFASAESALGTLNPARLAALQETATPPRRAALDRYLTNRGQAHARWLVGRVLFTAFAALLVAKGIASTVPAWALAPLGAVGALFIYGVVAEVATTFARNRAEYFATRILGLLRPLELLVFPLAVPLTLVASLAARWLGPVAPRDPKVTETEVEWMVTEGEKQGALAQEPANMIRNVLELKDLVAREVMIPRTRVCGLSADTDLAETLRFVTAEGHSRYPVYRSSIDNVVGLLYVKDLFRVAREPEAEHRTLAEFLRTPVIFVSEGQGVSSVLREMRARRQHMAVVIDEFGGMSGIVTLEDILEVIVGDIRDEYDTEEAPIQELGDGRLLADAAVSVHDLSSYLHRSIPDSPSYESLAGLLIHEAGGVPAIGTRLEAHGLAFIVRDADEKRVSRVEIVKPPPAADEASDVDHAPEPSAEEKPPRSALAGPAPDERPSLDPATGDGKSARFAT